MKSKPFCVRRLTTIGFSLVWSVSAAFPLFADTPAVSPDYWYQTGSCDYRSMVGWEFTVENPIAVTALGMWSLFGNNPPGSQVGLWDGSHTLVTSCTVLANDPASSDGFTYHAIQSVILQPGQDYTVAGLSPGSQGFLTAVSGSFGEGIAFVARRWGRNYDSTFFEPYYDNWPGASQAPEGTFGAFGASFTYIPIPEPSSFALGSLGSAALMIFRRRR